MFTDKNDTYWKNFSKIINADFKGRKYWYSAQAIFNYKGFEIIFDHYTHYTVSGSVSLESFVTRICCRFQCNEKLFLKIEKASLMNKILNYFSNKKVETGNLTFDSKYVIVSNQRNINKLINNQIVIRIENCDLTQFYIDTKDGIWGKELEKNHYEIATFLNLYNAEYNDLLQIKALFEMIIDHLVLNYNIRESKLIK